MDSTIALEKEVRNIGDAYGQVKKWTLFDKGVFNIYLGENKQLPRATILANVVNSTFDQKFMKKYEIKMNINETISGSKISLESSKLIFNHKLRQFALFLIGTENVFKIDAKLPEKGEEILETGIVNRLILPDRLDKCIKSKTDEDNLV